MTAKFVNAEHTAMIIEINGVKKMIDPERRPQLWAEWVNQATPYVETEEYQRQQADIKRDRIKKKADQAKAKLKERVQQEADRINKQGIEIDAETTLALTTLESKYGPTLDLGFFKNAKVEFEKEVFPEELSQLKADIIQIFDEVITDGQ